MGFKFEKLEKSQKPLNVANQLLEAIQKGDFQEGDKLPTEEELTDRTGVSRASVREALSALRLGGIVRTEVGKGTFVENVPTTDGLRDQILSILVDNPKPLELQEARSAFEVGVVEIAARKFSEEDERRVSNTLRKMKTTAEGDEYQRFLDLHKQFHLGIARAAKNKVIEDTMRNFQGIMNDRMWRKLEETHYLPDKRNYLLESHVIHRKIYSALADSDPVLARKRLKEHFEKYK
ncbi:FadR family transcriptional regulator [Candidatus Bipolaricaulota bacterium]|nr:FadR family transcriptional regulator [Candidatus Bipolaricaulota bacterium]